MSDIANTGERILLDKESPLFIARHLYAYQFCAEFIKGKKVLDIGSGDGYGSYFLSSISKSVKAIDYSREAVMRAKNKYRRDNLEYACLDVNEFKGLTEVFEVICCFQVIEHLVDPDSFVKKVSDLMGQEGIFICSTPNRLDMSGNSPKPVNPFHVKEYLYGEFRDLLGQHFKKVEILCLKRSPKFNFIRRLKKIGIFNFFPDSLNPVKRFYSRPDCSNFVLTKDDAPYILDYIAVCREKKC